MPPARVRMGPLPRMGPLLNSEEPERGWERSGMDRPCPLPAARRWTAGMRDGGMWDGGGCGMAPARRDAGRDAGWDAGRHQTGGMQDRMWDSMGCKTALTKDQKSPGTSLVTCQKASAQETIQLQQGWSQSLAAPPRIRCNGVQCNGCNGLMHRPRASREEDTEALLTCR